MTNRIKLLMVLEATGGGTRKHIIDLLEGIDPVRFQIVFAYSTARADSAFQDALPRLQARGIKLVDIPMVRNVSPMSDAVSFYRLWRLVRTEKPDLVHCHSSKAGFLGRIASKLAAFDVATVFTPHGLSTHVNRKYWVLEKAASWVTDVAIAVSASEYEDFLKQKLYDQRSVQLITLGLNCSARTVRSNVRGRLGLPSDAIVVAAVGYLSDVKNPLGLVEAARIAVRSDPRVHFLWVGDGDQRDRVQRSVAEYGLAGHFHFLGWHPNPQSVLADCDIFALTSRYESFGYVMCEAMLSELPVVATNVMGPRSVVEDEVTGYLVQDGNWDRFSTSVLQLANDRQLRSRMGKLGRKRVESHFNLDTMLAATQALYERTYADRRAIRQNAARA